MNLFMTASLGRFLRISYGFVIALFSGSPELSRRLAAHRHDEPMLRLLKPLPQRYAIFSKVERPIRKINTPKI
jgi:hypothetical protein